MKPIYRIVTDPVYGFRRLDPIPGPEVSAQFYKHDYYKLIRKGGRAPDIRRSMRGGREAAQERRYLAKTFYNDMLTIFKTLAPSKKILDIGCGTGEFLSYLKKNGYQPYGLEPSKEARSLAQARGLSVSASSLPDFYKQFAARSTPRFGAITLLNVLEHVRNPLEFIKLAGKMLLPGGLLCVKVPNDFNALQLAARKALGSKAWWIAIPDHIHYFDFPSLQKVIAKQGFEIVYSQGDFPMEMFLLMGESYVDNPAIGKQCHQKRMRFELALPGEVRRQIYRSLSTVGLGRTCLVVGKRKSNRR